MSVSWKIDTGGIDAIFSELGGGNGAGNVASQAARRATDKYIRKDTGNLAGSYRCSPWEVVYTAEYASVVWDVPPRIVSPRNPAAKANPNLMPDVAETVAKDLASYIRRMG